MLEIWLLPLRGSKWGLELIQLQLHTSSPQRTKLTTTKIQVVNWCVVNDVYLLTVCRAALCSSIYSRWLVFASPSTSAHAHREPSRSLHESHQASLLSWLILPVPCLVDTVITPSPSWWVCFLSYLHSLTSGNYVFTSCTAWSGHSCLVPTTSCTICAAC